jgi:hypothetical protein
VLAAYGDWVAVLGCSAPTALSASTQSRSCYHPVTNHTSHSEEHKSWWFCTLMTALCKNYIGLCPLLLVLLSTTIQKLNLFLQPYVREGRTSAFIHSFIASFYLASIIATRLTLEQVTLFNASFSKSFCPKGLKD